MPHIQGSIGNKIIAEQNITTHTMNKVNRRLDDPINCINIKCNLPNRANYDIGSMDVFDFGSEIQRINPVKYTKILELENQISNLSNNFKL